MVGEVVKKWAGQGFIFMKLFQLVKIFREGFS